MEPSVQNPPVAEGCGAGDAVQLHGGAAVHPAAGSLHHGAVHAETGRGARLHRAHVHLTAKQRKVKLTAQVNLEDGTNEINTLCSPHTFATSTPVIIWV